MELTAKIDIIDCFLAFACGCKKNKTKVLPRSQRVPRPDPNKRILKKK